jgi:2-oxoisovalerate dehydrogenase E1 component alpha subunit
MATLRVDGNDALAVYHSVRFARDYIIKNQAPFFLEFMTYRVGDHSTSDNSQMYRTKNEK